MEFIFQLPHATGLEYCLYRLPLNSFINTSDLKPFRRENRNGWLSCNPVPPVMKRWGHRLMAGSGWEDSLLLTQEECEVNFAPSYLHVCFLPQWFGTNAFNHLKFTAHVCHKRLLSATQPTRKNIYQFHSCMYEKALSCSTDEQWIIKLVHPYTLIWLEGI